MEAAGPFAKVKFWAAIGVSMAGDQCCIYVDTIEPTEILQPPTDRKYITHTIFAFEATKKAAYATIISNLRDENIYPNGTSADFKHPVNPTNKFYSRLPASKLINIAKVITSSIAGLSPDNRISGAGAVSGSRSSIIRGSSTVSGSNAVSEGAKDIKDPSVYTTIYTTADIYHQIGRGRFNVVIKTVDEMRTIADRERPKIDISVPGLIMITAGKSLAWKAYDVSPAVAPSGQS